MLPEILIFLVGAVILYYGAESLIKGAATLALRYGIRPLVVGLTVVALGTSMPEFVINFVAVLWEQDGIALGNIIGSNIANISLILGMSALMFPLSVNPAMLRKEYPLMVGAMLLFWVLAMDGVINQTDGLILVAGLIAFLVFVVLDARRYSRETALENVSEVEREDITAPAWKKAAYVIVGMVLLALGARMMIGSAVTIATYMGISDVVIGLTIVAVGTSLPELAASVVSATKDQTDLSVGNAMGSNLLNVLFVVGLISLIHPLRVSPESLDLHFPVMMGFSVLLLPLAWTDRRITRPEGCVLLAGFFGYMAYLVMPHV